MAVSAWSTYWPTALRWILVGAGLVGLMLLLFTVLRKLGVRREVATGLALILPWILGFALWNLYPFLSSLYLSFTDYKTAGAKPPEWIGLDNYAEMFTANKGWKDLGPALRLTMLYAVFSVPLGTAGALIVASIPRTSLLAITAMRSIRSVRKILPKVRASLL